MFSKKLKEFIGFPIFIQLDTEDNIQVTGKLEYIDRNIIILSGINVKHMVFPTNKIIAIGIDFKPNAERQADSELYN